MYKVKSKTIKKKQVLLVPAVKQNQGMGHLKRSMFLLEKLGNKASMYIPNTIEVSEDVIKTNKNIHIIRSLHEHPFWDIVVLDNMATVKQEFTEYTHAGMLLGIDEGGEYRDYFPYLIDTPLNPLHTSRPNMILNFFHNNTNEIQRKENDTNKIKKILISFGGEDSHNLSLRLIRKLIKEKVFPPQAITIIQGPLFKQKNWPSGVHAIINPATLSDLIPSFDLVFTHFGSTCFESILLGVPVILLNPTRYHYQLSKYYTFPEIGIQNPKINKLKKLLSHPALIHAPIESVRSGLKNEVSLPDMIISFLNNGNCTGNYNCPVCKKKYNKVIERFPDRSYLKCDSCHILYSINFHYHGMRNRTEVYTRDYFFDEYKKQYGKTYLEDFDHIKHLAHSRLSIIKKISGNNPTILDIGCAYGPFLAGAKEEGYIPEGMDISSEAATYVTETLGIKCTCADYSQSKETKKYDVITMWFVLEHFDETDVVLKKVHMQLKRGGVFAFSTPNTQGISFKTNKRKYLKNNPHDHYTLWNPKAAKKILESYGFTVVRKRITGHHPERFPIIQARKKGILYSLLLCISKLFRFGDTCEIYCQKKIG